LQLQEEWLDRWETLSHGERKRSQIAIALWHEPHALALDEPVNHLDKEARDLLMEALMAYNGVGLLVSHDRTFLDTLCRQCLFINPPNTVLRPGNYSEGLQQEQLEASTILKQRSKAKLEYVRLKSESNQRRRAASQADHKRSKRGLALGDSDSRAKINLARATGRDAVTGKQLRQLEGRLGQAQKNMDRFKPKKTYSLGIWMPGAVSKRNTLFSLPAGSLDLGNDRRLEFPDLTMLPTDRIALTGPNGCGKSTLVKYILTSLNVSRSSLTYIPQEIESKTSQEITNQIRCLPRERLGQLMTIVSCLGSRPQCLLETINPSPGEIRKLLLAVGILEVPHLIVLDEPTNHLDLPSIECLEEALINCPCGLILISHDERFLSTLTKLHWCITEEADHRHWLRVSQ